MAAISNLGIGSGLDLTTLLANITSAEQAPLQALQTEQTSYTTKLTAYGQISSAVSTLQSAATALSQPTLFQGVTASSSNTGVLSASAAASAASGTYAVNVTSVAQAQSLATAGVASSSAVIGAANASSTVTLDFGTISGATPDPVTGKYTGASFTADATRTATTITIDSSNNTLAGIRDAINASSTIGVTASIVNDGSASPNRLVLTSKQTGEASSMRIAVTGDSAIASLLSNNPAGLPAAQLQQTVAAQNANLTVNGIAVTSASNSVVGAIQDVTMNVSNVGASTLTLQNDTGSVQSAISTFVNAYNSLQSVATSLTAYDATKKTGGALLGDSTLRNIQVRIRSLLTSAQVDNRSGLTMLSQIGVSFQQDGTLAINTTNSPNSSTSTSWTNPVNLNTVLGNNLSGVAKLFSGTGGVGGFGTQMAALLGGFTATDGTLAAATTGINTTLDMLGKQYTATSATIDATVARYKAEFTQLDTLMSSMTQTSNYLKQQFPTTISTN